MSSGCISTHRRKRWYCAATRNHNASIGAHATGLGARHWPHSHQDPRLPATWHALTLFAAPNYLEGKLITRLAVRHRHQEWLAFLKTIDEETPGDLDIHIIADNYATHKHPAVTRWLDRHARFHMHYTPTSSSWMNLVERFFRDLTEFITEKSFASTRELADAIIAFLAARNDNPRRYVWKAKGEDILRKIDAARQALVALQPKSNLVSETPTSECGVEEINRQGTIERASHPRGRHRPPVRVAIFVEPGCHLGKPLPEFFQGDTDGNADGVAPLRCRRGDFLA